MAAQSDSFLAASPQPPSKIGASFTSFCTKITHSTQNVKDYHDLRGFARSA
jgi:hypothetical protein